MGHGGKKKAPARHAAAPVQPPSLPADLLTFGYDFLHNPPDGDGKGIKARVWAHKSAPSTTEKRPLIIYLHGNNLTTPKRSYLDQDYPQLYGPAADPKGSMHAGKMLIPEIDAGNVVPLVIACPSVRENGGDLWPSTHFDLGTFVDELLATFAAFPRNLQVQLDLDCVAVVAHSGGGGYDKCGLNRLADDKGFFTAASSSHELTLLGVADTSTSREFGALLHRSFGPNVEVYAVHREHGGWTGADTHNEFSLGLVGLGEQPFADTKFEKEKSVFGADAPWCSASTPPQRISIEVTSATNVKPKDDPWNPLVAQWEKLPGGAYKNVAGFEHHFDVVAVWTLWAARRYFSPGACAAKATKKAAAPQGSGCAHCDALQKMIDAGTVSTQLAAGGKDAEAIEHLQYVLVDLGYKLPTSDLYPDGVDGDYGGATTKAIVAYLKTKAKADPPITGDGKSVTAEIAKALIADHQAKHP
jgi:hypothetical protein